MASRKPKTLSLTQALSRLLDKTLLPDLQARAQESAIDAALQHQYRSEQSAERTADSFREFVERTLEQVGAAWILSCVFVRTLEDRKLLSRNRLAGEGAGDSEQLFFELAPSLTARDYLLTVFQEVSSLPGVEDVLGTAHNPAFRLSPSNEGARALLDFFREREEAGALRWQFAGEDTRFLGDLYQDLSEDVRKRYALLQTPHFVESFILDQTLTPAIAEYGLNEVRLIDPTCGSGHFLLGAFERLLDARLRNAPGVDIRTHALAALGQVYGVDVNPFAVAIARFRLTLAYLARCGFSLLSQAPKLKLNLVVGDSLLHGGMGTSLLFVEHESARGDEAQWGFELFALDDSREAARVFDQRYHAVVGNPPYITCKDAKLRELYRKAYPKSAAGKYALAAPFTERFFLLAVDGGYVGLINANSFMKREFGKPLIEKVLSQLDLTRVIDTAGAYIPGHGTPTVLLLGRYRKPASEHVSAVLGKRGEPTTPEDPEQGLVWRSIIDHLDETGFDNDYISVAQVPRPTLSQHPWSLGGGGAAELKELLEERAEKTLSDIVTIIGFGGILGEDDVYSLARGAAERWGIPRDALAELATGEEVRDWGCEPTGDVLLPYGRETTHSIEYLGRYGQLLWQYRQILAEVRGKGLKTKTEAGRPYYEYAMFYRERFFCDLKIAFAFVATHNHFVLDRGGKVFKQSAPIVKLPESATEDDHLALLAYLNSSTACFWMKQVFFDKGGGGIGGGLASAEWEKFFEFDGTKLRELPLPPFIHGPELVHAANLLAKISGERSALEGRDRFLEVVRESSGANEALDRLNADRRHAEQLLDELIYVQEELDWWIYAQLGWAPNELSIDLLSVERADAPRRSSRPALICYVRSTSPRREIERLFEFCGMGLPEGVGEGGSPNVQLRWQKRLEFLETNSGSAEMIEHPQFKRTLRDTWRTSTPDDRARDCLVDEAETVVRSRNAATSVRAVGSAIIAASSGSALVALAGGDTSSVDEVVTGVVVPFLSTSMFAAAGLTKHAEWKRTWDLQRREDLGEAVGEGRVRNFVCGVKWAT